MTFSPSPPIIADMAKPYTPTSYRRAFVQRVRASRVRANMQPAQIAAQLGVPKDTYQRYETRRLIPHHLIKPFCDLTQEDVHWLVTGERSSSRVLELLETSNSKTG